MSNYFEHWSNIKTVYVKILNNAYSDVDEREYAHNIVVKLTASFMDLMLTQSFIPLYKRMLDSAEYFVNIFNTPQISTTVYNNIINNATPNNTPNGTPNNTDTPTPQLRPPVFPSSTSARQLTPNELETIFPFLFTSSSLSLNRSPGQQ